MYQQGSLRSKFGDVAASGDFFLKETVILDISN